jgi:hypothetical protein
MVVRQLSGCRYGDAPDSDRFLRGGPALGCASDGATGGGSVTYVYDDWLYHHYDAGSAGRDRHRPGARSFVVRTLARLGLDLEPVRGGPGRPPGRMRKCRLFVGD